MKLVRKCGSNKALGCQGLTVPSRNQVSVLLAPSLTKALVKSKKTIRIKPTSFIIILVFYRTKKKERKGCNKHVRLHFLKPARLYMLFCLHWRAGPPRLQAQRVHVSEALLQLQPWHTWHGPCGHRRSSSSCRRCLAISAFARAGTCAGPTCGAGAVGIHGELKQGWGPETTAQRMARMATGRVLSDCFSQEHDLGTKLALRFLPWNIQ